MTALVLTLCRLHNFCIGEALLQNDTSTDTDNSTIELLAMDNANVVCDGGISLQDNEQPTPLMDGSDHLEDVAPMYEEMWKDRMKGMVVFLACQENG